MFLRNCWYVAAFGTEIADAPLARTLLNEAVVLYRTPDGRPVALADSCCHRALPLSMGRVKGENLQCGYHGLVFAPSGECVQVPGQSQVPPGASVRSYPVVERFGWVWIWMGDPALADPARLPDWHWLEDEGWESVPGNYGVPLHVACNYELITENLFDISHLSYVHAANIGNESIVDFPMKAERLERSVRMTRMVMDRPAAPFYQRVGKFKGNVDRWLVTTIDMPCHIVNHAGCVDTGAEMREGLRRGGVDFKVINAPTPETETTTHYFYAHVRNFNLGEPEMVKIFQENFGNVFHEDKVVLEAQQAMIDRDPQAPMIDVNGDAAGLQAKRILAELIAEEQATRQAAE